MSSQEFIESLRIALGDMNGQVAQQHLQYYSNYIIEEVEKGRSEQDVVDELGDPWIVAKNLKGTIDSQESSSRKTTYVEFEDGYRTETNHKAAYTNGRSLNLGCWGAVVIFAVVMYAVLFVISGIVKIISPILIPLLIVVGVVAFLKKNK